MLVKSVNEQIAMKDERRMMLAIEFTYHKAAMSF
jgi:hypothetical protein